MSKYAIARAEKLKKEKERKEMMSRYLDKSHVSIRFCLSHAFRVYPACQPTGRLKVFLHHHDKFLPESKRVYDQDNPEDMIEMYALIDLKYQEFYDKHKHRGRGKSYIYAEDYGIDPDSETIEGLAESALQ